MLFEEKNDSEEPDNPMELWLEQLARIRVGDLRTPHKRFILKLEIFNE